MSAGADMIAAERTRQIEREGWTRSHDVKEHPNGELAIAAAAYLLVDTYHSYMADNLWPFGSRDWKPRDRMRNLVRAGALIAAEIDRVLAAQALALTDEPSR